MSSAVYDTVRAKRAVRDFRDEPLPEHVVERIVNAGRLSGSAKNMQPWHFVAVQRRETLQALAACGQFAGHLAGAALGIALVTPDPFYRLTVPFDLGRATQNMMLAAWAHGVGSVMAYFHQHEKAAQALGLPEGYEARWAISFGYPHEAQDAPDSGGRRPFEDVVHWEKW